MWRFWRWLPVPERVGLVTLGEGGTPLIAVVSTGSTGLSNAAYAARAWIGSIALVPAGMAASRLYPLALYIALPYRVGVPTLLTKLAHAHPPDGLEALAAVRASGGTVVAVDDAAAVEGTRRIAAADGLYLEPSSGVLVPALEQLLIERTIAPGARVVGIACGSGFRETFALAEREPLRIERIAPADLSAALI
jgi:threonine synthase